MDLPINRRTPIFERLYGFIDDYGGLFNAHLHLDRALTLGMSDTADSTHDPSVHVYRCTRSTGDVIPEIRTVLV